MNHFFSAPSAPLRLCGKNTRSNNDRRAVSGSLSPQRGEGWGEGWEVSRFTLRRGALGGITPHPHSLSPLRGEGGRRRLASGGRS